MLIAGGSGIVPLMAILRHRAIALRQRASAPTRLLYSSRRWDDVIYRCELERLGANDSSLQITHTITREAPAGWNGYSRRIDRPMLAEVAWQPSEQPRVYVCGNTPLVEAVATELVTLGYDPTTIRTKRFGPTGGAR
jgi:ferredoxin-NADP reductase